MLFRTIIALFLTASVALGQETDTTRITKGDPLSKVHTQLGTPVLEYPLDDMLIQHFEECTVTSRNGVVISTDYKEAVETNNEPVAEEERPPTIEEIKILAREGDADSQYLLAYCFQFGNAIKQNYSAAVAWYTKAAMQGHMASQHNLGYMYMTGKGVEQDYEKAYMWALLAAENGNNTLKKALVHRVSPDQKLAGEMGAKDMQFRMQAKPADSKL